MSRKLQLTLACGPYDINDALIRGDVAPQGIELTVLTYPSPERHWRMSRGLEFDICELSMASYLMLYDRGSFPAIAVPAFPHRRFRHGFIFVNTAAGIGEPKDLDGRRVGVRTWQTTAGLWARGILQDDYGVDLGSIEWVSQDAEDVPLEQASRYRIHRVDDGNSVVAMVARGDLDGLIYPDLPEGLLGPGSSVVRLFPEPKAIEIEYVARTGYFPIMHTVVIRRAIVDAHPWVARNVLEAFEESKARAFLAMRDPRRVSLAWLAEALEEQERVLGPDPWAYDFASNRAALETMIRWSYEQGMISRRLPPEELFARATLEPLPRYA